MTEIEKYNIDVQWYTDDEGRPYSNFYPHVLGTVKTYFAEDVKSSVKVMLLFNRDESKEVEIPLSELEHIEWEKIDDRCMFHHHYRKPQVLIANMIRSKLNCVSVDKRYGFDRPGLKKIGTNYFFILGNQVIKQSVNNDALPQIKISNSSFRLDIDLKWSKNKIFEEMMNLINLSPKTGNILVAHAISGIIREAFKEAGLTPCTILFVVGQSGMLKSHYVPQLVQLYNRSDGIKADTRFNSTQCFIEEYLYQYSECTFIVDDLHTAMSRGIKRKNETTAEEMIRRISDDIGRGRKKGDVLVQNRFNGNAIFIGEYIIGKESTIPRELIVEMTEKPDEKFLDDFQRHKPLLVSTFYYFFIQWYVDHFVEIRDEIDISLTRFRKATANSYIHGRLRDALFYLQTAYMILLCFCEQSNFISEEEKMDKYNAFASHIIEVIKAQQSKFKHMREQSANVDFLKLICELYKNNKFRLAESVEKFNPDEHDGLLYYNCLCLRRNNLEEIIHRVFSNNIQIKDVIESLAKKQALKQVKDKRTVKISTLKKELGALRFYAIWLNMLI